MTLTQRLEEIREVSTKAHREICDLASGKRKWEMCIPPQSTDSDITLQAPLDAITKLITALEKAVEQRDRFLYVGDELDESFKDEYNAELMEILK